MSVISWSCAGASRRFFGFFGSTSSLRTTSCGMYTGCTRLTRSSRYGCSGCGEAGEGERSRAPTVSAVLSDSYPFSSAQGDRKWVASE